MKKYKVIKCKNEYIKFEAIHKIFAGPMGIIPKVRNTIREKKIIKKIKNVRNCHVNSLARLESACVLREGFMSFMYNIA